MKKNVFTLLIICLTMGAAAQMPSSVNYQAVARNSSGQALANQNIKVRLSIIRGLTTLYSETRNVTTNLLGLFNIQIGSSGATSTSGDFNSIYWLNNTPAITLKVELDVNNSGTFTEMGNQPFSSVPYAYAAKNSIDAVNLGGRYVDASITPNDGDVMKWSAADNAWKPGSASAPVVGNVAGLISNITPSTQFAFISSSTYTLTITKPTILIASGNAVLGHNTTGQVANDVSVAPAYQMTSGSGGPLTIFNPGNYPAAPVSTTKVSYPAAGSVLLTTPGTYKIGFAVRNNTTITINNNDWLSGYVMALPQ